MKRVRIRSMEDFDNLPEGEWVEVEGGLNAKFTYPSIRVEDGDLIVDLPKEVRRQFKTRPREDLQVRLSKGSLIVSRKRATATRRRR